MTRTTVDNYLSAYGLYKDIWAPLAEAGLNIGFSILLGYWGGLNGIIIGILISQIAIISIWKPFFLFRDGFCIHAKKYFIPTLYRYLVATFLFALSHYAFSPLHLELIANLKDFIIATLIVGSSCLIVGSILFYLLFPGVKDFVVRIKKIICKKI